MEHASDRPRVFISYSYLDRPWKDRVVKHLTVLVNEQLLSVWEDSQIKAGDDWQPRIKEVINSCDVALLLISANFLTSKFIVDEEVPALLKAREKEGV